MNFSRIFFLILLRFILSGTLVELPTVELISQIVTLMIVIFVFMQATYAIELTLRNRVTIAWYLQEEELLLKK